MKDELYVEESSDILDSSAGIDKKAGSISRRQRM